MLDDFRRDALTSCANDELRPGHASIYEDAGAGCQGSAKSWGNQTVTAAAQAVGSSNLDEACF